MEDRSSRSDHRTPVARARVRGQRARTGPLALSVLLGALLATGGAWGCAGDAGTAQESTVVPADPSVVGQRADRSRVRGDTTAPIRIVEISDFQCPYCAQFNRETFPALDSLYIQPGRVEYIWISFPNASHAYAWPAIEAAFCAGAAGQFWPMHDLLFEHQETWSDSDAPVQHFESYAAELDIDEASFAACLREDRAAALQLQDFQSINRAGISGTPFFIINDEIPAQGAIPLERFRGVLDSLLVEAGHLEEGESVGGDDAGDAAAEPGAPSGDGESDPGSAEDAEG